MAINKLLVQQFRNISLMDLDCHPKYNFFIGENGAGKTSILESIYYLSHGRTFKSTKNHELIQHHTDSFSLYAETNNDQAQLGVHRPRQGHQKIKKNGEICPSIAPLSSALPVKLLTSMAHGLISDGPKVRRQFLNWGAFHQIPDFFEKWKSYQHALAQRNQLLKNPAMSDQMHFWESQLIDSGNHIHHMLEGYFNDLKAAFYQTSSDLVPLINQFDISYDRGWSSELTLEEAMHQNQFRDKKRGFTHAGPHRSDIAIHFNNDLAISVLSQGQLKMLAYGLHLSQGNLFSKTNQKDPIYLIDDVYSELDHNNQEKIFRKMDDMNGQIFITAIDLRAIHQNLSANYVSLPLDSRSKD